MDAAAWLDWRSGAGRTEGDPGWTKFSGEWRYNWADRFIKGSLASSYLTQRDGHTNLALTWGHDQAFTKDRRFRADVNYVTSTALQRQNTFNPYQALATIRSAMTYSDKIGPATLQLGGTRTQNPGRPEIDQNLPQVSINTRISNLASWLQWTPNFSYNAQQQLNIDLPGEFAYRYETGPNGLLDSVRTKRNQYTASTSFDTPFRIFGYDLGNSFRISELSYDYPQRITLTDVRTGQALGDRIIANLYKTEIDWTPNFQLPPLARNLFNITPGVSLANVTSGPFWARTTSEQRPVRSPRQAAAVSLSASPVIYGSCSRTLLRLRHTLQPTISYSYAPRADVDDEYLQALGRSKAHEFTGLQTNQLSFGLNQNIEAKVRSPKDQIRTHRRSSCSPSRSPACLTTSIGPMPPISPSAA